MARPAAVLDILVTANTGPATASLARLEGQMGSMASTGARAAKLLRGVAMGAGVVGVASAAMSIQFKQSMTQIYTQAGAARSEVDKLSKKVLDFAGSGKTVFTPNQLALALYQIESAGYRGNEAMKVLNKSQKMATVGNSDLETTTYALVTAMHTGIDGTQKMGRTIAQLDAIVGHGNMRMEDLTHSLTSGILVSARGAGLSLKEAGAALDIFTRSGVPASVAATRLRYGFNLLSAAATNEKASKALQSIGIDADKLGKTFANKGLVSGLQLIKEHLNAIGGVKSQQARDVMMAAFGGSRSGTTIQTLLFQTGELQKLMDQLGRSTGKFQGRLDAARQTPLNELKRAWSEVSAILIHIGDVLVPAITSAVTDVTKVITDPNLTAKEKLTKIFTMATDAAEAALPKIAAFGVQAGEKIISGIWHAFTNANPLGKLLIGASVMRLFGGAGVFSRASSTIYTGLFGSQAAREKAAAEAEATTTGALTAAGTAGKAVAYEQGMAIGMAQQEGYMTALTEAQAAQGATFRNRMPGTGRYASPTQIASRQMPVSPAERAAAGLPPLVPMPGAGVPGVPAPTTVAGGGLFPRMGARLAGIGAAARTIGSRAGGAMMGAIAAQMLGSAIGGKGGEAVGNIGTGAAVGSMFGPEGLVAGAVSTALITGWQDGLDSAEKRTHQFANDVKTLHIPLHLTPSLGGVDSAANRRGPAAPAVAADLHTAALAQRAGNRVRGAIAPQVMNRRSLASSIAADEKLVSVAIQEHGKHSLATAEAESRLIGAERAHKRSSKDIQDALEASNRLFKIEASHIKDARKEIEKLPRQVPDNTGNMVKNTQRAKQLAAETKALRHIQDLQALATINSGRALKGLQQIAGDARDRILKFADAFKGMPGLHHLLLTTNSPKALDEIAKVSLKLDELGKKKTVTEILGNSDNAQEAYRKLSKAASDTMDQVHKQTEKQSQAAADAATHAASRMHHNVGDSYSKTQQDAAHSTGKMATQTDTDGKAAAQAGKQAGQSIWKQLGGAYLNTAIAAAQGISNIKDNTSKAMKALGAGKVINFVVDVVKAIGGSSQPAGKQQGGLAATVPGAMPGDHHTLSLNGVPIARLESQEGIFIGNRNMMAAAQAANEQFPRFQKGGKLPRGFKTGGGVQYALPWPGGTSQFGELDRGIDVGGSGPVYAMDSGTVVKPNFNLFSNYGSGTSGLVYRMDHPPKGFQPSSNYVYIYELFKPQGPGAHGGRVQAGDLLGHIMGGTGIEMGWSTSTGTPLADSLGENIAARHSLPRGLPTSISLQNFIAAIQGGKHIAAGAGGGIPPRVRKLMNKIDHTRLRGPAGVLKNIGQGALNKVEAAANALIQKNVPSGGGYVSGGGGPVAMQIARILAARGWNAIGASGVIGNAVGESNLDPGAVGTGGGGLWGFTSGAISLANLQAAAKNAGKPWTDVGFQTEFMLAHGGQSLRGAMDRQGSPSAAADYFMTNWEHPGILRSSVREGGAQQYYGQIRPLFKKQRGGLLRLARGGSPYGGGDSEGGGEGKVNYGPFKHPGITLPPGKKGNIWWEWLQGKKSWMNFFDTYLSPGGGGAAAPAHRSFKTSAAMMKSLNRNFQVPDTVAASIAFGAPRRRGPLPTFQHGGPVPMNVGQSGAGAGHLHIGGVAGAAWHGVEKMIGRHARMPAIRIGGHHKNWNGLYNSRKNVIKLAPSVLRQLRRPGHSSFDNGLEVLLHEMAHANQHSGLSTREAEGGAELFAHAALGPILHSMGLHPRIFGGRYVDRAAVQWVQHHRKPSWWLGKGRHTQFRQRGGAVLAALAAGGLAPAMASGGPVLVPQGATTPKQLARAQAWANSSLMPLHKPTLGVSIGHGSTGGVLGQAAPNYVNLAATARRKTLLHEFGHVFDMNFLHGDERAAMKKMWGLGSWYAGARPANEYFADAYSVLARQPASAIKSHHLPYSTGAGLTRPPDLLKVRKIIKGAANRPPAFARGGLLQLAGQRHAARMIPHRLSLQAYDHHVALPYAAGASRAGHQLAVHNVGVIAAEHHVVSHQLGAVAHSHQVVHHHVPHPAAVAERPIHVAVTVRPQISVRNDIHGDAGAFIKDIHSTIEEVADHATQIERMS